MKIEELSYKELQSELKERDLLATGKEEELKARLLEALEESEEVEEEVEEAEGVEEEVEEQLKFGVNSVLVDRVKDVSVHGKPMKKVFLANGTTTILSEEELGVRLKEGER